MTALAQAFRASADRWQVPLDRAVLLNLAGILGVPALALLFFVNRGAFRLVLDEDRLVEWAQFALFLGAGAVGIWIARNRFRLGLRVHGVVWVLFALAMVVIAGEEISWGQRLLGIDTPDILEEVNRQGEITFHNIGQTLTVFNLLLFFGSLYGVAAEWIERRWRIAGRMPDGDRLYVPPFFLAGLFGVMLAYRLVRTLVLNQESYALTSLSEWAELCFAVALFLSVALSARWLARRSASAPDASPS